MRYVIRMVVFTCCVLASLQAGPAQAEKRVALVIGNSAYRAVSELPNPRKDARDVAAALKAAAFSEVVEHYDLSVREMRQVLSQFEDKVTGADWAVVYYAGHGIEVDGRNYLVPIDAELKRATDVEDETLPLDRVLARIAAAGKLQLVILDACRFNPFTQRMAGLTARAIGERGLARIEPAHPNVIVAYAARDGEVALDGRAGDNSPYAGALVKHLSEPGLELQKLFRRVREDVMAKTGGKQRPYEYGSLIGPDLFFRPAIADPKPQVMPQPSEAVETARICREVEGMSNFATLTVLERQHKGRPAGECVGARIEELKKLALAAPPAPSLPQAKPLPRTKPLPQVVGPLPERAAKPVTAAEERALKSGDRFKECDECPEMVVVPAGGFMMGSPPGEAGRSDSEGPQHRVTIAKAFAVGKLEVTFTEWDACVASGGCSHRPDDKWGRGNQPVINVSWNDITRQYLPWLSRKTGKTYRLLTEAEWEYVARAGTTTQYHFGNDERDLCTYGNVADQTANCRDAYMPTAPVGSFQRNAFGLHDVHGNVWEWVQDCWNDNHNGASSDGSARTTGECSRRVLRGGSWINGPQDLRSAVRGRDSAGDRDSSGGFRVARTLTP
jgi:formylglycine-generating enzyme required for sulfatase activity